jgi:hypothetical protein
MPWKKPPQKRKGSLSTTTDPNETVGHLANKGDS